MRFMVCFIYFLFLRSGFSTQAQPVVCIGPIQILVMVDMVIVMMMIDMKAAVEEMKIEMVMGEKENGPAEMKTGMVEMGTHMVLKVNVMVESLKNGMVEMVIRMMITEEEVRNTEEYQYGSRSRSADRDGDRAFDDESNHSSR